MSGAKILITGMANTGKTTLLRTLTNCLVFSRDGKPFSLPLPHVNVPDYQSINELLDLVSDKLDTYNDKVGKYPDTIVFDSVSRIFTDMETYCSRKFKGFDVWSNVNKEINLFLECINELIDNNYNVILIAHCVWDEKAGTYVETCKGSFAKVGGFLSTVDYALNIDIRGKKRIITHRGTNLARTLIETLPDMQESSDFNLQKYVELIKKNSSEITEKWSI